VPDECVTNFKFQDIDGQSLVVARTKESSEFEDTFWQSFDISPNEKIVGCYGFTDEKNSIIGLGFLVWATNKYS
jgi:hypothetical protein